MEWIRVTPENIDREHICCAISGAEAEDKKRWMKDLFEDELTFVKADARGKVFIEYLPAERGWRPIQAPGYLLIHCIWVSGKFQGQGLAGELLEICLEDAKAQGKQGVAVITGDKNRGYLPDPKFFKHHGFAVADVAQPFFELLYLPLQENAAVPKFREQAKGGRIEERGFVLYYANQCPFAQKYGEKIATMAREHGQSFVMRKIETREQAQSAPTPFTSYTLYYDGAFVSNEVFSEKKFLKLLESYRA